MAAIDTVRYAGMAAGTFELPAVLVDEIGGYGTVPVQPPGNLPRHVWLGTTQPIQSSLTFGSEAEDTVLGPDEVSRSTIGLATAPVYIDVDDQQANEFVRFLRKRSE